MHLRPSFSSLCYSSLYFPRLFWLMYSDFFSVHHFTLQFVSACCGYGVSFSLGHLTFILVPFADWFLFVLWWCLVLCIYFQDVLLTPACVTFNLVTPQFFGLSGLFRLLLARSDLFLISVHAHCPQKSVRLFPVFKGSVLAFL